MPRGDLLPLAIALVFLLARRTAHAGAKGRSVTPANPCAPIIPDVPRLPFSQLRQLAVDAGFPDDKADTAAAIAVAESGGNPRVHGDRCLGHSFGLWQINRKWWGPTHPDWFADEEWLYVPANNASAAHTVWQRGGFVMWSTYTHDASGKYVGPGKGVFLKYLPRH